MTVTFKEPSFMFDTIDTRSRTKLLSAGGAIALIFLLAFLPTAASAQPASSGKEKPTVILVHGAWADGSSWNGVITRLLKSGYTVYAPPNPLRGLASDAATIATFVKSTAGPVILVGRSYGGAVISVAAPSDSKPKALVYVDAFAPDEGESQLSLLSSYPPPPKDFFTAIPFACGRDADV
jgi:pimeloyl-ACP methyl ester carboxylesterase